MFVAIFNLITAGFCLGTAFVSALDGNAVFALVCIAMAVANLAMARLNWQRG